jgi:hypothetical protein
MSDRLVPLVVGIASVTLAGLAAAGCTPDACAEIDGAQFLSVGERECGLGPEGPEMCHWSVSFEGGGFSWSYSDVVETGTYECDDGEITASGNGSTYQGSYDPDTGTLTWDGFDYLL